MVEATSELRAVDLAHVNKSTQFSDRCILSPSLQTMACFRCGWFLPRDAL